MQESQLFIRGRRPRMSVKLSYTRGRGHDAGKRQCHTWSKSPGCRLVRPSLPVQLPLRSLHRSPNFTRQTRRQRRRNDDDNDDRRRRQRRRQRQGQTATTPTTTTTTECASAGERKPMKPWRRQGVRRGHPVLPWDGLERLPLTCLTGYGLIRMLVSEA